MVILVAVFYCLANIPGAVVYFHRARHLCMSRVPLRSTQAFAHVLNSGINFFIYIGVSPAFRKHFLKASGLVRFVGGERLKKPASLVSMAQVATAEV